MSRLSEYDADKIDYMALPCKVPCEEIACGFIPCNKQIDLDIVERTKEMLAYATRERNDYWSYQRREADFYISCDALQGVLNFVLYISKDNMYSCWCRTRNQRISYSHSSTNKLDAELWIREWEELKQRAYEAVENLTR